MHKLVQESPREKTNSADGLLQRQLD